MAASEAVAQVGVGIDAEFLAGLNQRREDIHRPGPVNAAAVQAHVAPTRTHASPQLRGVVVQRYFWMRKHRQQFILLGRRFADPIIEHRIAGLR